MDEAGAFLIQQRFILDAAQELRTPVATLRRQVQVAEHARSDAERAEAIRALHAGFDRMERLTVQLLQLARAESGVDHSSHDVAALDELARQAVSEFSTVAEQKGIDLGACADESIAITGDTEQLRVMLNNLVRNAVAYALQQVESTRRQYGSGWSVPPGYR